MARLVSTLLGALAIVIAASAPVRADGKPKCIPPSQCCRVCVTGKACGKTCIAASKTCHVGRGCACDAAEVCAEDP